MERLSLKSEGGSRLDEINEEIASLAKEQQAANEAWQAEKGGVTAIQMLKEQLDQTRNDIEVAEREYDLGRAAELKYSTLPQLTAKLAEEEAKFEESGSDAPKLLRDTITAEDIASIVSSWTGVPVTKLAKTEADKVTLGKGRQGDIRQRTPR